MPGITRKDVDKSAGHCFNPRPADQGSPNVIVNGYSAVRVTDHYPTHNCGDNKHDGHASVGSNTVIVNGQPVHRIGDDIDCGDVSAAGSPNVMAGSESFSVTYKADKAMTYGDDVAITDGPVAAKAYVKQHVDAGTITQEEMERPVTTGEKDSTPPPAQGPITGDCSEINTMSSFADSYQLTAQTTLGMMTKKVTFPHQAVANMGQPLNAIVCNLKMLALNCWEPIKSQYPNAFITNSFRPNQGKSQHNIGQAMDIQFTGIAKSEYFTIAQWVKANVKFDQLLLEYKTTGSGLPWIHISFNAAGNRGQVLTLLNDATHSQGLVNLA